MWWNLNLEGPSEESLVQVKIPTRNVPNGTESVIDDDDLLQSRWQYSYTKLKSYTKFKFVVKTSSSYFAHVICERP